MTFEHKRKRVRVIPIRRGYYEHLGTAIGEDGASLVLGSITLWPITHMLGLRLDWWQFPVLMILLLIMVGIVKGNSG
jgi:hypothetical protein